METKPVITCLKTLLIVYSFVFWVRVLPWSRRRVCARGWNSRNCRFPPLVFPCVMKGCTAPASSASSCGNTETINARTALMSPLGLFEKGISSPGVLKHASRRSKHIFWLLGVFVCVCVRACARTIASWLSFSRLKDASHRLPWYPTVPAQLGPNLGPIGKQ